MGMDRLGGNNMGMTWERDKVEMNGNDVGICGNDMSVK